MLRSISSRFIRASIRVQKVRTQRRFAAAIATRTPQESYVEKHMPFSTNEVLRNAYVNTFGNLRVGLLLEDLDRLAGAVAYQHMLGTITDVTKQLSEATAAGADDTLKMELPVTIVTAGCDSIQLFQRLHRNEDLIMAGRVVATGRSSMEVFLQVDSLRQSQKLRVLEANFTMVARDSENRAAIVPAVVPTTEEEHHLNTEALMNRERRKKRVRESLDVKAPTAEESQIIHNLFMDRRKQQLSVGASFDMQSTKRQSVVVMQPQKRNIHHKIFGGYLMRLAFEHGWASAWIFAGLQPHVRAVDEINFLQPVEIGNICTFNSMVVYARSGEAGKSIAVVEVVAAVIEPATRTEKRTNTFYFTFSFNSPIPSLQPVLYEDAIKYLDGKRRADEQEEAVAKDVDKFRRQPQVKS